MKDTNNLPGDVPLESLWLNRGERIMLKKLARHGEMLLEKAKEYIVKYFGDSSPLITLKFKYLISIHEGKVCIVRRGHNWIELNRNRQFEKWIPMALSLIAIVISIIAIYRS